MTTDTAPSDAGDATPPARSLGRYLLPFFLLVLIPLIVEGFHALAVSADWARPLITKAWGYHWHTLGFASTGAQTLILAVGAALVVFFMFRRRSLITYLAALGLSLIAVSFLIDLIFRHLGVESYGWWGFARASLSSYTPLLTGLFVLKAAGGRYDQLVVLGVLGTSLGIPFFPFVLAVTPVEGVVAVGGFIVLSVVSFFAALIAVWTVVRLEDTGTVPSKVVVVLSALVIFVPALLSLWYNPFHNSPEQWEGHKMEFFFRELFSGLINVAAAVGIGALGIFLLRRNPDEADSVSR